MHLRETFIQKALFGLAVSLLMTACGHALIVESDPDGADVYLADSSGAVARRLGSTPLKLDFNEFMPGSGGAFLYVQKQGFERQSTFITSGSFGGRKEILRFRLSKGVTGGALATRLVKYVRNAQKMVEKMQLSEAHSEIDKALELEPNFVFGLSFKAGLYFIAKNYDEAEKLYKKVLDLDPDYDEGLQMLARIKESRGAPGVAP